MASKFRLQIIDTITGNVVAGGIEPGRREELDFISDIVQRTLAKGVGFFRTENHVAEDLYDAIEEAILELKKTVRSGRPPA